MRVAHIVSSSDAKVSGVEMDVLELARHERGKGVHAEMILLDRSAAMRGTASTRYDLLNGVPVQRIAGAGYRALSLPVRILTSIAPFDVVHVHRQSFAAHCLALTQIIHRKTLILSEYNEPRRGKLRWRPADLVTAPLRAVLRPVFKRVFHGIESDLSPSEADAAAHRYVEEYGRILGEPHRNLLGVTIRTRGREQAVSTIDQAFAEGQRLNVGFVNAHSLNIAIGSSPYRAALEQFLVLNDGLGINLASRLKYGKPFAANLNGTDFVPYFLTATVHRLRIFLVGTSDAAVSEAARTLSLRFPRHSFVGCRNGFFDGPNDIEETCQNIRASDADCVLVGMGNPLQELWIDEHGAKTGARLFIGVGALLDFQAGAVRRAPNWVRRWHCEWAYRLAQEPRRLARRYLVGNFVFLGRVLLDVRH